MARWEHFEQGADIGVRGFGGTKAQAYEQAALALTALVADPGSIEHDETVEIRCQACDDEWLLVAWLNAIVMEMAARQMLFARFRVELDGTRLRGKACGEPASTGRHPPAVKVRGASHRQLRVGPTPDGGWLAQTVVDI